ncbi:protein SMALL AUXIN UP-REGULATED RNA 9-like [Lycium ferocissimum]|uniref:protein SMALL AUXIN UP-REGULATED RNA 9-like n=1 Tax=Lycium ferocissimum TaxID=112874 RepID=UPI002815D55C|nr:protein SMALL AUXIN UP-REGULATED RNA 9-like [Lycium ferocissimum]
MAFNKLSQAAVLKQILKKCSSLWKKHGYNDEDQSFIPLDAPKGHFVVYFREVMMLRTTGYDEFREEALVQIEDLRKANETLNLEVVVLREVEVLIVTLASYRMISLKRHQGP